MLEGHRARFPDPQAGVHRLFHLTRAVAGLAGLSLVVLLAAGTITCRGEPRPPEPSQIEAAAPARSGPPATGTARRTPPPWPPPVPSAASDWCVAGVMDALDEQSCYVLPDSPPRELLIYLHGIVPPTRESTQKTKVETVVSHATRRAGAAALLPRGKQGFARDGWWGWPTSEPAFSQHAPALIARISDERRALEGLTGLRFARTFVAGSSAGGYFAALLALHGTLGADGYGAMSGASGHRTAELARLSAKPFYIGYGTHDSVGASSRALGELLKGAGWPVKVAAHPLGHGAQEVYLDEAFAFWRQP